MTVPTNDFFASASGFQKTHNCIEGGDASPSELNEDSRHSDSQVRQ